MLPDYKESYFVPLKFRQVHGITVVATIATGAATLDTTQSSPGVGISGTGGTYTVTLPKGQSLQMAAGFAEKTAGAAANTDGNVVSFGPLVASAGTIVVYTQNANAGALTAPADGKLRLRFEVSRA